MEAGQEMVRAPAVPAVKSGGGGRWRRDLTGWGFMLPFMAAYALFLIWPVILMFKYSFTNKSLVGTGGSQFLGFQNYGRLFGDPAFWQSLWHTVWFTILSTPPLVILALVFAMLTNRVVRGQGIFRFSFFAPFVLPVSVVCLIWIWMYEPGFGLIDGVLGGILGNVAWLGDPNVAMISIVITTIWWTLGFNFVLYLAGLQEIPRELYDAAAVDGAGAWAQARWITLPLLKRTTLLVLALQILASLKIFDQVYIMTYGGPNFTTRPIIEYFYDQGFTAYQIGYASAVSVVYFVIILAASVVWFLFSRRREETV
ncbi:MAG: sugar ABC transporter permease [Rubrobacteraceae bacterium]|uniref:carbohydrate ABC transporter permease n=1 Tax=Rubrobacter naiadicus TaxID=1392641 RepID=UPI002362C813|nr:sugar ABC transporter permease [Rubrobacter naiadicus]MBX6762276.1 sugar ABC transporter permease [Rubrobacteraceae bacterium]MCL6436967.1 sugar ABC transporter permease [Rubrobacteraceae bacterium]